MCLCRVDWESASFLPSCFERLRGVRKQSSDVGTEEGANFARRYNEGVIPCKHGPVGAESSVKRPHQGSANQARIKFRGLLSEALQFGLRITKRRSGASPNP